MKHFAPGWTMTLVVCTLLPLLAVLGYWQLARAAEKRDMHAAYLAELTSLPVPVGRADLTRQFQRVRLTGAFADEAFLLDNRVLDGVAGYWLVQVFDGEDGRRYLTNLGFVQAPPRRAELPPVSLPAGRLELDGVVWPFTGLMPMLDEDVWADGWPKRAQRFDAERMAAAVGAVPVEIRVEPGQPGVGSAAPFAVLLDESRHLGYAATWFGLAVALVVLYIVYGVRAAREDARPQERT